MVRLKDYKVLFYKDRRVFVKLDTCGWDAHQRTIVVSFSEAYQLVISCETKLAEQYFDLYTAERWITELKELNACRCDGNIDTQIFMALPMN